MSCKKPVLRRAQVGAGVISIMVCASGGPIVLAPPISANRFYCRCRHRNTSVSCSSEGQRRRLIAIARLKSLSSDASAISLTERRERQEKARILMRGEHLSAILMTEGTCLTYFTGMRWWGGERLFAMVLTAKGESFYVCPGFEEGRAREQIAKSPDGESPTSASGRKMKVLTDAWRRD